MKIYIGDPNHLPARTYDEKGETFDEDVYVDTVAGFRVLGTAGEKVSRVYYEAVLAGCEPKGGKPAPKQNKGGKPASENK
jgi:hypothetical protein